jgi:hypothetical protein
LISESLEVYSSEEIEDSPCKPEAPKSTSSSSASKVLQFLDAGKCCLVRMVDGVRCEAVMSKGPGGFALALFAGDTESVITEVPNIMMDPAPQPKAKGKGKAKAKAEPKAKEITKKPASNPAPKKKQRRANEQLLTVEALMAADAEATPELEDVGDDEKEEEEEEESVEDLELECEVAEPIIAEVAVEPPVLQVPKFDVTSLKLVAAKVQTYIVGKLVGAGSAKKPLVVAVTEIQCKGLGKTHYEVCKRIFDQLLKAKGSFPKSKALALRDSFLK